MGLNLTVGYAGQKSLGHAAFFGIGAYTVAILLKAGVSFWVGLPLAALICFCTGLVVGFPALRVQTIYLAFATLGFNTAIWLVMRNEEWLTGGNFGINNIARPSIGTLSLDGNLAYYFFVLVVTLILAALLAALLRSPWGKAFTALRDNPIRAESLGIDTRGYTLLSFAIGAAYAGIAGGLYASQVQFIDHDVPHGGGGWPGLFPGAGARLGRGRGAARMAALCAGLVSVGVRGVGGASHDLAARWVVVHPRAVAGATRGPRGLSRPGD
jgi:branched-chain amino acid transport system permease protein